MGRQVFYSLPERQGGGGGWVEIWSKNLNQCAFFSPLVLFVLLCKLAIVIVVLCAKFKEI